jgi:hypothetical protein
MAMNEDDHLAGNIKLNTGQTGDEECRRRLVKRGAIHIDRCAERHDKVGDVFFDMQMLFCAAQGDR